METNANAAYGLYSKDIALTEIVRNLNHAGFDNEDICMMLSHEHPIASAVREASFFSDEQQTGDGTTSLIGWLSKFGAVLIPRVGFFIRSQAFFHALMLSRDASALCGRSRTLVKLGFSEQEARRYEGEVEKRGALVYVSCAESAKSLWAREVLRHAGAFEVSTLHDSLEQEAPLQKDLGSVAATA